MSIRTVSGRREELPLPPPSSCFVPSPHTLHPVFCLHFVVPSSSLSSSVFCPRLPSIYPLRVFPFLRGRGLLFYRVLPSIALLLPPTSPTPGTDSPVDAGGRFGRGGAHVLAAWNLDSCPIPPLHRFVVNRSAPDTLPLVPLPAAVSIPPFLCFCSPCSLSPSHIALTINPDPDPSIPYTVRRDKRENERRQHRIRYIRDRPRIVHYTHPDSTHGRSIIRIYRLAYILSHTVLCLGWGACVSDSWSGQAARSGENSEKRGSERLCRRYLLATPPVATCPNVNVLGMLVRLLI